MTEDNLGFIYLQKHKIKYLLKLLQKEMLENKKLEGLAKEIYVDLDKELQGLILLEETEISNGS